MNQLVIPSNIDFSQLVQTGSTLTVNFQSNLIKKLEETFTESEQRWYIANLYMYVNYHPTNDFPIDLENVYKLMGFAHKKNAKRTLENNFALNEEYKILLLPTEKQVKTNGGAGLNKEQILLNVDTFKNLCMLTKSEESKKIRRYYIRLETIYNELIMEEKKEFEKQLEDQQKQLEEKQNELEKTKKQLEIKTKLAVKKWYDQEPGHVIYGFRSTVVIENENKQLITIGKSKNVAKRESSYMTHNQHGEMFYIRKCYNCDLAEKVLHHMLDKFREERNKEWFHISEELTTYAIDTVCDFLDIFINCSEKLPEYKIKEFMNKLPINRFDTTLKLLKTEDLYIPDVIFNKNTKDFNTFFNECCEKDEMNTSDVLIYEVTGAYRIWCKQSLSREMLSEFKTYINTHFTFKEKYFANTGIRHKIITNLKLKELKMTPDDKYNIKTYERFCLELCVCNYTYKIKITDFMENYTLWMKTLYVIR